MSARAWIGLTLVALGLFGVALFLSAHAGHRRPPHPRGMLLRLEAREVRHPMDRILVDSGISDGKTILVECREGEGLAHVVEYRFPSGERISEKRTVAVPFQTVLGPVGLFDMDGDSDADVIDAPAGLGMGYGTVRVVSGHDGRVLFEDRDPLEYECSDRAFALPDLDGDGCSELALVHPRQDRSRYDLEIWDMFLGAKSWITIVSGREATR